MKNREQQWLANFFAAHDVAKPAQFSLGDSWGHKLAVTRVLIRRERDKRVTLPWWKRLRSWKHGFNASSYLLFDLDAHDPTTFLSDTAKLYNGWKVNGHHDLAIDNKVHFYQVLDNLGCPQPKLRGILVDGELSGESLLELLEVSPKLVLKPIWGGGGQGILFLERRVDDYLVNGESYEPDTIIQLSAALDDYFVSDFIEQHSYARNIIAESTNTIRVLTLWHERKPYVAAVVHRFGRGTSKGLDNFKQGWGGLSCAVNDESGELGLAVGLGPEGREEYTHHPLTGAAITGVHIPSWAQIKAELLEVAGQMPYVRWLGWDIVATDRGWTCLEGNPCPGIYVWQAHVPLLKDPRSRAFFKENGVI